MTPATIFIVIFAGGTGGQLLSLHGKYKIHKVQIRCCNTFQMHYKLQTQGEQGGGGSRWRSARKETYGGSNTRSTNKTQLIEWKHGAQQSTSCNSNAVARVTNHITQYLLKLLTRNFLELFTFQWILCRKNDCEFRLKAWQLL